MKIRNAQLSSFILLFPLIISGCATTSPGSADVSQNLTKEVPSLKIVMDCGGCQVRPNAADLIVSGYTSAASKSGAKIANNREASVTIKEYIARDDTSRMLAGALAGKDEIKAVVAFDDKRFEVEDYYRNAWLGINSLSEKIGEMIFEKITQ